MRVRSCKISFSQWAVLAPGVLLLAAKKGEMCALKSAPAYHLIVIEKSALLERSVWTLGIGI